MRYAVVVESEKTDGSGEDGEGGSDAIGEDQITGVVAIDILGRESVKGNVWCVRLPGWGHKLR